MPAGLYGINQDNIKTIKNFCVTKSYHSRGKDAEHTKQLMSILILSRMTCSTPVKCTVYLPAGIYLLKVNNRNTRTRCVICSKLTIKTPERRH